MLDSGRGIIGRTIKHLGPAIKIIAGPNHVHFEVGQKVRKAIEDIGGTMPEDLPTAESIKRIESKQRRLEKAEMKKLEQHKGEDNPS